MNIFADTAGAYWGKGIPVIPLHKREKRPIPLDWSRYHDMMVEEEIQQSWLDSYSDGNIGLVLGKQARVVMIDIDTPDDSLIEVIREVLPTSPWTRIGAKGMVLAYRWNGTRTFRIKNVHGESIVEHLSDRTQVVLPPSIHPDTGRPYTANGNLFDLIDNLPVLDTNIEQILRQILQDHGVELSISGQSGLTEHISRGSRDTAMTEKAGLFAYAVIRGERSLQEAIGMLRSYESEFVQQVAGDGIDVEKHVDNLIKFLKRDVFEKGKVLPEGWDDGLEAAEKKDMGLDFDKDHEEWSFDELLDHLKGQFEKHPRESQGRSDAVEYVLQKIARSSNISKLEEERLIQYIVDVSQLRLKMGAIRTRLRELRQGEITGADHSEIAKAVLDDLEEVWMVRRNAGELWRYKGSHWEPMPENEILAKIARDYGHMQAARKHSDHNGVMKTMITLADEGIKRINEKGVNFANGFLTETLEFVDHDPDQGMVYTLPFRYVPEMASKAHQFFDFLQSCWGQDDDREDKIAALQEAMCVTLFGMGPRFQRALLLKGVPKSGKSQMLKIAQSLVPDGARCFVPPNEWADRFMPSQMHEKLINVCGELSEKKRIDGQKFKDIIDGAEMSGQYKGKQIFKFCPQCVHWFASNHTPKTEDSSEGFNRRWLILEFNRPVPPEEREIDLGDRIVSEEREAIVAWAVQAMMRLKENSEYTLPRSHKQLIREVAQENNSVLFFMQESPKIRVVSGSKTTPRISENKLYNEYWAFCLGPGGAKPVGSRVFRGRMRELQSAMGFTLVLKQTSVGAQEAYYNMITLVGAQEE